MQIVKCWSPVDDITFEGLCSLLSSHLRFVFLYPARPLLSLSTNTNTSSLSIRPYHFNLLSYTLLYVSPVAVTALIPSFSLLLLHNESFIHCLPFSDTRFGHSLTVTSNGRAVVGSR